MNGKVKWYDIKQGYGFIEGNDGKDAFIHKSNLPFWTIFLETGDNVRYSTKRSSKGLEATELEKI